MDTNILPTKIAIGKNGRTVDVDWTKVPQNVMDHIAATYFPQYITDRANSGGKDSTDDDRVALAMKKIDAMYAGDIRTRTAGEPADPIEAEARRLVVALTHKLLMATPEWKQVKGKDKFEQVVAMRHADDPTKPESLDVAYWVVETNRGVELRKQAAKNVADRAKAVEAVVGLI